MPHCLSPRGALGEKEEAGLNVQGWDGVRRKGLKHVTGGGKFGWSWGPQSQVGLVTSRSSRGLILVRTY